MKTLHVIVANKVATYLQRDGYIVCGNSDYQIEFSFDSEWDSYTRKTARFIWNGKFKDVEFSGTVCPVPIISNTVRLEVGVYAEDICTTTSALITCKKSIRCNSNVISEGTVVIPNGSASLIAKNITENGTYTPGSGYDGFSKVTVAVPSKTVEVIPDGYIKPSGTISVTENKTVNVTQYASAKINVPIPSGYIKPSGTKPITTNGTHDVTSYASVTVEVEAESIVIDSPLPIEVASEIEMNALLYSGEVGGVYKYVGDSSGTYEKYALYVLEEEGLHSGGSNE